MQHHCVIGRPIHQEPNVTYKLQLAMLRAVEDAVQGTLMDHPVMCPPLAETPMLDLGWGVGHGGHVALQGNVADSHTSELQELFGSLAMQDHHSENPASPTNIASNPALAYYYRTMLNSPRSSDTSSTQGHDLAPADLFEDDDDDDDDELLVLQPGVL
eukprot:TRINITY_DN25245_c0_g1_i1.p2 TRINITY_DN25245_c0_g1~~TRINITY_DN25245_c0_g1_i1.p2  ORF type:complete len:158 (+),score=34.90 TRINITY_DN25245_c0_g1_i1:44-517(+)